MKYLITLILFLSAAGSCDAAVSDWEERDKRLYASYIALNVMDINQTFELIDCQNRYYLHGFRCDVHEVNPFWGDPPKKGTVVAVKLGSFVLNTMLLDTMSTRDRRFTLRALNAIGGAVVINNQMNGLSWRFRF